MPIVLVVVAAILAFPRDLLSQTRIVQGVVLDSVSGQPITNCNVSVSNTFIGTNSHHDGSFTVRIPAGDHRLTFQHVGYYGKTIVVLDNQETLSIVARLAPKTLDFGTVTIEASGPARADPSTFVIDAKHARNVPALGEPDIVRTATWLPGITQVNDLRTSLHIRGGSSDQNQFFLDGIEIYNPRHLLGLSGAFNMLALERVEVYTGNLPARYGDRLSGVIDVQTVDPTIQKTAMAHVSLVSSGLAFSHSYGRNSLLVAARRTYLDGAARLFGKSFPYYFYDANVRLTRDLGSKLFLDLLGFVNVDDYSRRSENHANDSKHHIAWGNRMGALRLRRKDDAASGFLTLSVSRSFNDAVRNGDVEMDNTITDLSLQFHGQRVYTHHVVEMGAMYKRVALDYTWNSTDADEFFYRGVPIQFKDRSSRESYLAYGDIKWFLTEKWWLQGSARGTIYSRTDLEEWSPRMALFYRFHNGIQIHMSVGRYYQFVGEGKEALEGSIASPLFFLPLEQRATTYSTGFLYDKDSDFQIKGEVYIRDFDRIATLNTSVRPYPVFEYSTGKGFGLELWLEKTDGWWTGQLAYTYQRVFVKTAGSDVPADWDAPHSLKGMTGFRLGKHWIFNVAGTYRSGTPYTPVLGTFFGSSVGENQPGYSLIGQRFVYGRPNSDRLPYYFRVDISFRRSFEYTKARMTLYLQVLNVLFRQHPLRYDWDQQYMYGSRTFGGPNTDGLEAGLPIIPSLGIELELK